MTKRAREDDGGAAQQHKKPKRDDASNPKMTNKDRYEGNNGYFCPEWFKAFEEALRLNNGVLPPSIALDTSDWYHMNVWTQDDLPSILFFIKAPKNGPVEPVNVGGQMLMPQIVPRIIAIDTPEWKIGAWLRLDRSITLKDIRARMHDDLSFIGGALRKPSHSTLNNRMHRKCARLFGHLNGSNAKNQQQIIADVLTPEKIARNTILDPITINGECRLVKKKMVFAKSGTTSTRLVNVNVTESNYKDTTFPENYFQIDANDSADAPILIEDNSATPTALEVNDFASTPALIDDSAATPALTEGVSPEPSSMYDPATPAVEDVAAQDQLNHVGDLLPSIKEAADLFEREYGDLSALAPSDYLNDTSTDWPPVEIIAVAKEAPVADVPVHEPLQTINDPPAVWSTFEVCPVANDAQVANVPIHEPLHTIDDPEAVWSTFEVTPAAHDARVATVPVHQPLHTIEDPEAVWSTFKVAPVANDVEVPAVAVQELLHYINDPPTALPPLEVGPVANEPEVAAVPVPEPLHYLNDPSAVGCVLGGETYETSQEEWEKLFDFDEASAGAGTAAGTATDAGRQ